DPTASMQWALYWCNIVQCFWVMVTNWPENILFENLSKASNTMSDLELLLHRWKTGKIYWKALDDEEFVRLNQEQLEKIDQGEVSDPRRHTRSDKGKKRKRVADLGPAQDTGCCRKVYRSATPVPDEDNEDGQAEEDSNGR
ncbi:hypothetical protein BU15DRAFT_55515, partial [Melanogaster broomeanus]